MWTYYFSIFIKRVDLLRPELPIRPGVTGLSGPRIAGKSVTAIFPHIFIGKAQWRSVRWLGPILLLFILVVPCSQTLMSQVDLALSPGENTVQVSESFEVSVRLSTQKAQKVDLAEVYLLFDPVLLKVEAIVPLGSDLGQSIFTPTYDNVKGMIGFIGSTVTGFPVGNLELIRIVFKVKAAGQSAISFYDPAGPASTIVTFKGLNVINATSGAAVSTQTTPSGYFMMVDANSDTPLFPISSGLQISNSTIGSSPMGIVFYPATPPGSVKLTLGGPVSRSRNEGVAPYSLFGDINGNISGIPFPAGNYTLNADPVTGPSVTVHFEIVDGGSLNLAPTAIASGNPDPSLAFRIHFSSDGSVDSDGSIVHYDWDFGDGQTSSQPNPSHTYATGGSKSCILTVTDNDGAMTNATITVNAADPNSLKVSGFDLIDALTDEDLSQIQTNEVISGNKINIRANTHPGQAGSVRMVLSGPVKRTTIESVAPYTLFGDSPGPPPDYYSRDLPDGLYNLIATPYELSGGKGAAGQPLSLQFTVGNQQSSLKQGVHELKMHPNPAVEVVSIDFTYPVPLEYISIYDTAGRLIEHISVGKGYKEESYLLRLEDLPDATYFVRIRDAEGMEIQRRLIVKRD